MDCASDPTHSTHLNDSRKPPLVRDLFNDTYRDILDRYPLAQAAAAGLRPASTGNQAIGLEDYLRDELRNSPSALRRAQYWAVPLYLQELLFECGWYYTSWPDNFDRLVTELDALERVVFVTLNYDTIFDRVLARYYQLDSLDSYAAHRRVALIKLHGSVNWGRHLNLTGIKSPMEHGYQAICHALAADPARLANNITFLGPAQSLTNLTQFRAGEDGFFFPALAAPLGPTDQPVCDMDHLGALRYALDQRSFGPKLHLLIIGYSCLDQTPLDLIKESGSSIVSTVVVNGNTRAGEEALQRMQEHMPGVAPYPQLRPSDYVEVFPGGFTEFARTDRLRALVERVRDAPET